MINLEDESKKKINIDYYVRLVLKRRWFLIIPLTLSLIVGLYIAITSPKIYNANTLIIVEPKSIPDKYVPNIVNNDVRQRVNTIRQEILSNSNLEAIINRLNLFADPKYRGLYMVDKVREMRSSTTVDVTKSHRGVDAFQITYKGEDPEQVMSIVNTLAESFINESVKLMESEIIETNSFLDDELTTLRLRLEKIEEEIKDYRRANMGELPEELSSNLRTLDRLQAQLIEKQQNLRDAKNRLAGVENQMSNLEMVASAARTQAGSAGQALSPEIPEDEPVSELDQLRQRLNAYQLRYTERHPDVIRLKQMIASLEAGEAARAVSEENKASDDADRIQMAAILPRSSAGGRLSEYDKTRLNLLTQQDSLRREIQIYQFDIGRLESQIQQYQQRVEMTPRREQDLMSLRRNYENIQRSYASMLDRKLESDIAVNMERKQKGEKFRVIDRAKLPQRPVSPDMRKLFVFSLAAGLVIGGGLIFLLDILDTSLKLPQNVEPLLGVPVLATIPDIPDSGDMFRHKTNQVLSLLSLMVVFILVSVFSYLTLNGVDRALELVNRYI